VFAHRPDLLLCANGIKALDLSKKPTQAEPSDGWYQQAAYMQAGVIVLMLAPLTAGLCHLSSHEGGKAVKCAGESTSLCQAAAKAAAVFDKSAPASLAGDHQYFDAAFAESTASVYNKVCMVIALLYFCCVSVCCRIAG